MGLVFRKHWVRNNPLAGIRYNIVRKTKGNYEQIDLSCRR